VLRLLSIDAVRSRYFHIFLHIYRTLVAGSEASAWNGRCQRVEMELSHELYASRYSGFVYKIYSYVVFQPSSILPSNFYLPLRQAAGRWPIRDLASLRPSMRFVAYRCGAVHVAKHRLLLGTRQMATRTYDVSRRGLRYTHLENSHQSQDAITKLNSLQSNFAALEASRASGGRMVQFAKHEMVEYLGRIGYKVSSLPLPGESYSTNAPLT